ncbi:hypothetical protein ACLB2K_053019 [Fragaria x ananassa]
MLVAEKSVASYENANEENVVCFKLSCPVLTQVLAGFAFRFTSGFVGQHILKNPQLVDSIVKKSGVLEEDRSTHQITDLYANNGKFKARRWREACRLQLSKHFSLGNMKRKCNDYLLRSSWAFAATRKIKA